MFFYLPVVDQAYDLQVFPSYAYLGNTASLKCLMPPFVKEFLQVNTWMWGSEVVSGDSLRGIRNVNLLSDTSKLTSISIWGAGGRYSVFPDGELLIANVSESDSSQSFRCLAKHKLTGEKTVSSIAGR